MLRDRLVNLMRKWSNANTDSFPFVDVADYLLVNGVIVLPVEIGVKVWCLAQPCGGCHCYNEPMKEEFIEICRSCDKWEIIECDFDYDLISEFGKTVFATREEAEGKYKELMKKYGASQEVDQS